MTDQGSGVRSQGPGVREQWSVVSGQWSVASGQWSGSGFISQRSGDPRSRVRGSAAILVCSGACNPAHLLGGTVMECVEYQFYAAGDAELFEDPEQIFFYRMLAEAEFACHVAIAEAITDEGHDLFFPRGEQLLSTRSYDAQ